MTSVSVVIPTVGRRSLDAAIASVIAQTHPVTEILVMVDVTEPISIASDDERVRTIVVGDHTGAASARQRGVEAATGEVIALLDDDDLWHPDKIERQLRWVTERGADRPWIASCRSAVRGHGRRDRILPRRVIQPDEPVLEYLFGMSTPRLGNAMLQTSTLCFPREIAMRIPLDADPAAVHDEPTWLHHVQQAIPALTIHQLPECLAVYTITAGSLSNNRTDDTARYIDWGRKYLADTTPRARGDYYLTSPVSAAASAHSHRGVVDAVRAGFELGRPGPGAMVYAAAKYAVTLRRGSSSARAFDSGIT